MRTVSLCLSLLCSVGLAQVAKTPADDLFREGTTSLQAQDYSTAEFWLREMRSSYPKDTRWGTALFAAYAGQNKLADALEVAREIQPRDALYYQRIGTVLLQMGRPNEALAEYRRGLAVSNSPSATAMIQGFIGDTYTQLGQVDEAIAAFRKQKDITGQPSFGLAYALGAKGAYAEEVAEYRGVLRVDPNQATALNNLAYVWAEHGENLNEAQVYAERAVDMAPRISSFEDTLAWVYFKRGMLEEAEDRMVGALRYEGGTEGTLLEHLAAVMDARGVWTDDRRALRKLLQGDLNAGQVADLKVLLGRMRK